MMGRLGSCQPGMNALKLYILGKHTAAKVFILRCKCYEAYVESKLYLLDKVVERSESYKNKNFLFQS